MRRKPFRNIGVPMAKIIKRNIDLSHERFNVGDYIEYMAEIDMKDPGRISVTEPPMIKQHGVILYIHPKNLWILVNRGFWQGIYIPDTIIFLDFKYIKPIIKEDFLEERII
ncbi:MAG: hypothetical protein LBU94_00695 [Clostridiales bacterium]|jgi:hypothetical protein|nr:hypothetical protein [Clostridiales bacterium]